MKTVVFKVNCLESWSECKIRVSRQDIRMRACYFRYKDQIRLAHHVFSCSYPQYYHDRDVLYLRGASYFKEDTLLISLNAPSLQRVFDNILLSPFLIETERLLL